MRFTEKLDSALREPMMESIPLSVRLYEEAGAKETLKESYKPQAGIYYWVPLPDEQWELLSFWNEFYGNIVHAIVWKNYVANELANLYKVSSEKLMPYPYGLPRGRIFVENNKIQLWHGDDTPIPNGINRILQDFNLNKENTEIIHHKHEDAKESHKEEIMKILS